MVAYPKNWQEVKIGNIFNIITDYFTAGSFRDLSENVKYYNTRNYAQLIRTTDIKANFKNNNFVYIDKNAYNYLWKVQFDFTKIIYAPHW